MTELSTDNRQKKKCSRCKKIKLLSEYPPCKTGKYGLYNYCRSCHTEYKVQSHPNRKEIDEREARRAGLRKNGLKTCSSCKEVKLLEEFYPDPRHADGKQSFCKMCFLQSGNRQYRQREYGIDEEQFITLSDFQDGVCAICGRPPKKNRFNIDHCHKTHRLRGLLCVNCNTNLLPYVENFPGWIKKAIEYLEDPPAFKVLGEIIVPESNQARSGRKKPKTDVTEEAA